VVPLDSPGFATAVLTLVHFSDDMTQRLLQGSSIFGQIILSKLYNYIYGTVFLLLPKMMYLLYKEVMLESFVCLFVDDCSC